MASAFWTSNLLYLFCGMALFKSMLLSRDLEAGKYTNGHLFITVKKKNSINLASNNDAFGLIKVDLKSYKGYLNVVHHSNNSQSASQ